MFSEEFTTSTTSFIKLEDGERVIGVFAGDPLEYKKNFELKEEYPMGLPSYPPKTTNSFKINFLTPYGNGKETKFGFMPRVFQGTPKTAKAIENAVKKYGKDYVYEVTRSGTKTSTSYSVFPERALTEEEKSILSTVKLIELTVRDGE